MAEQHVGKVVEITGPVVVVAFEGDHLPPIYNALHIVSEGFDVPHPSMSLPRSNSTWVKGA